MITAALCICFVWCCAGCVWGCAVAELHPHHMTRCVAAGGAILLALIAVLSIMQLLTINGL